MADAMEDAYARGLEAGKAMKTEEVKDEESLDLDQRSDVKFAILILVLVGVGFITWFSCGYMVARHSGSFASFALTRLGKNVLTVWRVWGAIIMAVATPLICMSVRTVIKYLAQCISRKKKNRANQNN